MNNNDDWGGNITVISKVRYPGLYLRQFVPNHHKDIPHPDIYFADIVDAAGVFISGDYMLQCNNRVIDCSQGVLMIRQLEGYEDALAHEWRHHWQRSQGIQYDGVSFDTQQPYQEEITRYFTESWCEMDALKFAWKRTGFVPEDWREFLKLPRL